MSRLLNWLLRVLTLQLFLGIVYAVGNLKARKVLVVAGNFSIDGQLVNIAQYDITKKEWSTKYEAELFLYGESNGIIWDLAVNKSSQPYTKLFVVGAFDTVSETSQIQFCSVGAWDGLTFDKVGEGLCPRGGDSSTAMSIQTTALGNDGDIFVGGSFESRVWDGHHFVNVYHVAHYDGHKSSWLPLVGASLQSDDEGGMPRVNTLAWDGLTSTLYVGGTFYAGGGSISSPMYDAPPSTFTSGLAVWSESQGLQPFPGGGLYRDHSGGGTYGLGASGFAFRIAFEPQSTSLFVAGIFSFAGYTDGTNSMIECQNIAVWQRKTNEWRCLYQVDRSFSSVTSLLVYGTKVFVSGWASSSSDWNGRSWGSPYAIAVMNIGKYIEEAQGNGSSNSSAISSGNNNNTSNTTGGNSVGVNSTGGNVNSKFLHPITHSLTDPSVMNISPISSIRRNISRYQRKLLDHSTTARKRGGRNHNHMKKTEQLREHRLYDSYIEEEDLTYASNVDQVLSIFYRSSSSNYRAIASRYVVVGCINAYVLSYILDHTPNISSPLMSYNNSGAKDWMKIFAMQRRIRRRLRSGHSSDELDLLSIDFSNKSNGSRSDSSRSSHTIQQHQQQQETRTQRRLSDSHSSFHSYPQSDHHHRNLLNGNNTPTHPPPMPPPQFLTLPHTFP